MSPLLQCLHCACRGGYFAEQNRAGMDMHKEDPLRQLRARRAQEAGGQVNDPELELRLETEFREVRAEV